jgi:hypothetical protein
MAAWLGRRLDCEFAVLLSSVLRIGGVPLTAVTPVSL